MNRVDQMILDMDLTPEQLRDHLGGCFALLGFMDKIMGMDVNAAMVMSRALASKMLRPDAVQQLEGFCSLMLAIEKNLGEEAEGR